MRIQWERRTRAQRPMQVCVVILQHDSIKNAILNAHGSARSIKSTITVNAQRAKYNLFQRTITRLPVRAYRSLEPNMVTTRTKTTGGRSGVVINQLDDSNVSLEGWLDSATSPEAESKQKATATSSPNKAKDNGKKASRKKTVKTPKQQVDMGLRGAENEEGETDSSSAKKYVSKLKRKGGFTSPGDLSKVSTVAYSPRSQGSNDEDETGGVDGLLTQENVANQAANSADSNLASSEDDFPAGDDDGDDLAPPVLPQDESNDEESKKGESGDDFANNNDYDDHDDGPGFNMVHDPETPLTVREARAKNEMDKIREERRKKNKENGVESESDDNNEEEDDDSKSAMVKKSKKSKKKNNRRVVFSPKGIPIANRDYQTVPVGAYVEGSPDADGPRRSRRAKIKPLQFWRGEKTQYGPHEEHGFIGKAFGDMPVVTGIQKALPTPYKKRKTTATKKSGSSKSSRKNDSSDARGTVDEEEFNSKKLRRKFKFHDGEEAYLWDDIAEETSDQSKLLRPTNRAASARLDFLLLSFENCFDFF